MFKTPIGMSPCQLMFFKACKLLIELEHKIYLALRKLNMNLEDTFTLRVEQLQEINEFCFSAYESSALYMERMKRWHDVKIIKRKFKSFDDLLVFNSRYKLFLDMLKIRCLGSL